MSTLWRPDEPVELGGEGDLALARRDALGAYMRVGREVRARHAVEEDEGPGPVGEHDVDGPLGRMFAMTAPSPSVKEPPWSRASSR